MKKIKLLAIGALAVALTGCTTVKINETGALSYSNGAFQKKAQKVRYVKNGTNVIMEVQGLQSDSANITDALRIMQEAYLNKPAPIPTK